MESNMKQKGLLMKYLWKYKFHYVLGLPVLLMVDYLNLSVPQITGDLIDGLSLMTLSAEGLWKLVLSLMTRSCSNPIP